MKQSLTLIPTLREIPSDIEVNSHIMLLRAGYLRQSVNGVYSYLPLAIRLLKKLIAMISEDMENLNAVEIRLPILQPRENLEQSHRVNQNEHEIFMLKDSQQRELILSPGHEEAMTILLHEEVKSYKRFPLVFYEVQTKFKDESRPRYGLLRSREQMAKNAYSFHSEEESLTNFYDQISQVYRIFLSKLGLTYEIVEAGLQHLGPKESFIIDSEFGETVVAYSNESNYQSKLEVAKVINRDVPSEEPMLPIEKIESINVKTIEEVCEFFNIEANRCIKSLVIKADDTFVVVLVRGDHHINLVKLSDILKASNVRLADDSEVRELLNCSIGSIGPIKLPIDVKVIADWTIQTIRNGVAGANEDGYHYCNVNPERDFAINCYEDIRYIKEGEPSPDGQGTIHFKKGIEVGCISKHHSFLSEKLEANFIDEKDLLNPILMGSYQLNLSKLLAVMAEIYQDQDGFIWPKQLSPYDLHIIPVNRNDEVQFELATQLYHILTSYHFDVLFDDRDESVGVKFVDSDLIGLPVRITIGKRASEGIVEVKIRKTGEIFEWAKEELIDHLNEYFRSN